MLALQSTVYVTPVPLWICAGDAGEIFVEVVRGLGETLAGNYPGAALAATATKAALPAVAEAPPAAGDIPDGCIRWPSRTMIEQTHQPAAAPAPWPEAPARCPVPEGGQGVCTSLSTCQERACLTQHAPHTSGSAQQFLQADHSALNLLQGGALPEQVGGAGGGARRAG